MHSPNERRHDDQRITALQRDVDEMKVTVREVHDILTSFRTLAAIAKWVTAIAGAFTALVASYHVVKH